MSKLIAHFPNMLSIKESLIQHVFEPANRSGLKPSDVQAPTPQRAPEYELEAGRR